MKNFPTGKNCTDCGAPYAPDVQRQYHRADTPSDEGEFTCPTCLTVHVTSLDETDRIVREGEA